MTKLYYSSCKVNSNVQHTHTHTQANLLLISFFLAKSLLKTRPVDGNSCFLPLSSFSTLASYLNPCRNPSTLFLVAFVCLPKRGWRDWDQGISGIVEFPWGVFSATVAKVQILNDTFKIMLTELKVIFFPKWEAQVS